MTPIYGNLKQEATKATYSNCKSLQFFLLLDDLKQFFRKVRKCLYFYVLTNISQSKYKGINKFCQMTDTIDSMNNNNC